MIEFIQDHRVKPYGPDYKKGERFTGKLASENHFLRKGVAIKVAADAEPVVEKKSIDEAFADLEQSAVEMSVAAKDVKETAEQFAEAVQTLSVSQQVPASPEPTAKKRGTLKRK